MKPRARDAKAITSPVSWTLLGLIVERPSYRYELCQRFERLYGDVRPLSSESHIYAALKTLRTRGLVEESPRPSRAPAGGGREAGGGHQGRLYYRATAEGVSHYQEWLVDQIREDRRHSELLVRQLAVFARQPQVALQMLERYELALLAQARSAPLNPAGGRGEDAVGELIAQLVQDDRRLASEAKLAWIGAARSRLRELLARQTGAASETKDGRGRDDGDAV
ncbi:MAG TPA: helix-turn-helix transcriptional regulator, partial [Solirubrobacteraceae bacterium]|nr:helix-turn-helix transcriptional regulator [Solirubrobacteraceae bacterium]